MVKKGILNELVKTQNLTSLEQRSIYSYLTNNKLNYTKSKILTEYFKKFEKDTKLVTTQVLFY